MIAHRCLARLRQMELDAPQTIDIGILTDIGSICRVREYMPATSPWTHLFEAGLERAHLEITLEFCVRLRLPRPRLGVYGIFLETPVVTFTLCGAPRPMTLPLFVVAIGLYSLDEAVSHAFLNAPTTTS
ncbi:hypothetical protein Hanom_Chr15g01399901 [Helianthus anomalus]